MWIVGVLVVQIRFCLVPIKYSMYDVSATKGLLAHFWCKEKCAKNVYELGVVIFPIIICRGHIIPYNWRHRPPLTSNISEMMIDGI